MQMSIKCMQHYSSSLIYLMIRPTLCSDQSGAKETMHWSDCGTECQWIEYNMQMVQLMYTHKTLDKLYVLSKGRLLVTDCPEFLYRK